MWNFSLLTSIREIKIQNVMFSFCSWFSLRFVDIVVLRGDRGRGKDATYERGGDARWKF